MNLGTIETQIKHPIRSKPGLLSKLIPLSKVVLFTLFTSASLGSAFGADFDVNKNWRSIAIKGYDTVAYFTLGKAVKGKSKYEYRWHDARWRFSSKEHRDMFEANPDLYAPRFGGFCAGGIALGQKAPIDPKLWIIVDGQLYLNYDKQARSDLVNTPEQVLEKANENWKTLRKN